MQQWSHYNIDQLYEQETKQHGDRHHRRWRQPSQNDSPYSKHVDVNMTRSESSWNINPSNYLIHHHRCHGNPECDRFTWKNDISNHLTCNSLPTIRTQSNGSKLPRPDGFRDAAKQVVVEQRQPLKDARSNLQDAVDQDLVRSPKPSVF